MPRKLRVEYEGAIYHVMNRGGRLEAIFLSEEDREQFLETLGMSENRLADPCLLPDGQSFSGGRDAAGQPGGGNEVVFRHLHDAFQPAAQVVWPCVQRALQIAGRRWECQGLLEIGFVTGPNAIPETVIWLL
jgi:hypothetical protein